MQRRDDRSMSYLEEPGLNKLKKQYLRVKRPIPRLDLLGFTQRYTHNLERLNKGFLPCRRAFDFEMVKFGPPLLLELWKPYHHKLRMPDRHKAFKFECLEFYWQSVDQSVKLTRTSPRIVVLTTSLVVIEQGIVDLEVFELAKNF